MVAFLNWMGNHWQPLLSLAAVGLSFVVGVLHLLHQDNVAGNIQRLEDLLLELQKPKPPQS